MANEIHAMADYYFKFFSQFSVYSFHEYMYETTINSWSDLMTLPPAELTINILEVRMR